jgi:hypothetical protein
MIGMRVIKADDVETANACVPLDARHFDGINFVTILGRICPRIAATYYRLDDVGVVLELAEQCSAALVGIRFLTVTANLVIIGLAEFQHRPLFYHAASLVSQFAEKLRTGDPHRLKSVRDDKTNGLRIARLKARPFKTRKLDRSATRFVILHIPVSCRLAVQCATV